MPFSTGLPYKGRYRYFIDPEDPKVAILQEYADPPPVGYKTISRMRFQHAKIKDVLFVDNFTITVTDDNRIYMGKIDGDATSLYNKLKLPHDRIVMVSGCHIMMSQKGFFENIGDVRFYYNKDYSVCFTAHGKSWLVSPSEWPNLNVENTSIITWV